MNDYDKHFVLTADIDLAGHIFDQAMIAPTDDAYLIFYSSNEGAFTGTIDGNGHVISNLTVIGGNHLGLVGVLMYPGQIRGLGIVDANVVGTGYNLGLLAGHSDGHIRQCFALGSVAGEGDVGGLVGTNYGVVENSFSGGSVSGVYGVGGLTGNQGSWDDLSNAYSTCHVRAESGQQVGGLSGVQSEASTYNSFWDIETSGISSSGAGTGLTTALLQDKQTYLQAGWDFVGESENGLSEIWLMPEEGGYPALSIFHGVQPPLPFDSGVALGRCTLSEDSNEVMWNGADVFDARWDHVSRTEAIGNAVKHSSLDPNNKTRVVTIDGSIHVLNSGNLLGIDARHGVVCQVLDEQGDVLSLEGKLSPFEPSFCWAKLPETSDTLELQFELDADQSIPSHLSQVDFYVYALDCALLTTIDVPFEVTDTWKEVVPGFEVMIQTKSFLDGGWQFTLAEKRQERIVESQLLPEITLCEATKGRGVQFAKRLWDVDALFDRNIITGEDYTSGGGTHGSSGGFDDLPGYRRYELTKTYSEPQEILKIQYTFALSPRKRIVPLTLTDIPIPLLH
ncbi:MAG: hypothetical protein GY809_29280 [Planctomycetes bacterium]|nr:hypothetical protein [Planctomycetota bacterium]